MLIKEQVNKIQKGLSDKKDRLPVILGALGDPGRFRIFKLLMEHPDICVTDVANVFNITVSAASQQLRVLEMLELVEKTRMGQMVCYELKKDNPTVGQLIQFIRSN
ncbi:MAG: metalloregulator ArsR/SmtB family transcription factor [bacterium]|nr:metalloregulator ArsR/SmtB family transcription factor [bacterium]MDZ4231313.1 metalloregulator ArsR/SmtB family transcription factor [Patescibacteria group bacterium]